jgi:hypothetical protein
MLQQIVKQAWHLMQHLANHSTYHRGQIRLMMRQLDAEPLATDFHMFLIEGRETNRQPGMDREHWEGASAGCDYAPLQLTATAIPRDRDLPQTPCRINTLFSIISIII